MSDMIYTGMHIPTSCSMCWVRGTCEVWAMELHKQRGHGKRLDKCPLRPLVRCKDCRWWDKTDNGFGYCHAEKHCHISAHWEISIFRTYRGEHFCADGEREDDE